LMGGYNEPVPVNFPRKKGETMEIRGDRGMKITKKGGCGGVVLTAAGKREKSEGRSASRSRLLGVLKVGGFFGNDSGHGREGGRGHLHTGEEKSRNKNLKR